MTGGRGMRVPGPPVLFWVNGSGTLSLKEDVMSLNIHQDPPPIRLGEDGAVRVGPTRVTLETVIHYHSAGLTPEEIVESFDTLSLADVYATIGYYYRHKDEVDAFLRAGEV